MSIKINGCPEKVSRRGLKINGCPEEIFEDAQ
jgi:hypothetical protein